MTFAEFNGALVEWVHEERLSKRGIHFTAEDDGDFVYLTVWVGRKKEPYRHRPSLSAFETKADVRSYAASRVEMATGDQR